MERGEWVRIGWSERQKFHRVVGFDRERFRPIASRLGFGDTLGHVRPILACGKRIPSIREARPWSNFAGEGYSGGFEEPWYHRPPPEPAEDQRCRACRSADITKAGEYATDSDAAKAMESPLAWLGLAVLIAAILALGWLLSTAFAFVTDEEGRRAECESRGGRWMSEFDYIVEYEGRVPGLSEDPSLTESCYE